jgi:serine/threonine-protein kinase
MDDTAFGPSPTLPARFGRYHVVAAIPGGNMGRLYLAQDPDIDRMVVVKALDGERSTEEKTRFLREARAAGRLSHANVVSIFDVGEQERTPFIVMEYIDGQTLAAIIKNREPMLLSRKLEIVDQLCAGLAYAHDMGVVHRDIKPSNLMIDKADALRILDFGIARLDTGDHTQTSSGVVGTLNYMSPEQWEGGAIEQRSDIFSVGAVVYELLSYARAFPGSAPPEVLRAVFGDGPPPLEDIVPGLPPELSAIVKRMLARMPEERYPSLHVVRAALVGLKAVAREAEEQMLGETVHMDRPPVLPAPGTSATKSPTSIGKTATLVRDLTARRTATQSPVTSRTATITGVPTGVVTGSLPMQSPPDAPTQVTTVTTTGGRGLAVVGITVGAIAIGLAGLIAWKILGSNNQTPGNTPPVGGQVPTATSPPAATGSNTSTASAAETQAASLTPSTSSVGDAATPKPAPPSAPRGGGATGPAGPTRGTATAPPATPRSTRLAVSGPYAFELRQGNKVISQADTRHDLDVDVSAGAITARNAEYFLSFTVNPRSSPVVVPPLGHLVVNVTPETRDACRLMIDGQEAGSPMQPTPGLPIASGQHQIGLRCGTQLVDVKGRDISPGDEPLIITLSKSGRERP